MAHSRTAPVVARCLRRVWRWGPPLNWNASEWSREASADAEAAAWEALRDYRPSDAVSLESFLQSRIMSRLLTQYRREWRFAHRVQPIDAHGVRGDEVRHPLDEARPEQSFAVAEAVATLDPRDRWLVDQYYWQCRTELDIARELNVSQPAIAKRKQKILLRLRRRLAGSNEEKAQSGYRHRRTLQYL
ncbi:MAG: sigma-70 family RNA polymerase sigma factor [Planctomycetes bacterium]|nr:sigma-70 family RNA polymerase sigma factor [Planctomycetota bacterium]MBI3844050.1 sigma-70 family RNA polymerase sigma factor [Planctomycetota bacterium]